MYLLFSLLCFICASNVALIHSCNLHMCSVAQLCLTLCNPLDYSLPGSSVHAIFQARILEWVAISISRRSSQLRDWTHLSCIGRWILYHSATWEDLVQFSDLNSLGEQSKSLYIHNVITLSLFAYGFVSSIGFQENIYWYFPIFSPPLILTVGT